MFSLIAALIGLAFAGAVVFAVLLVVATVLKLTFKLVLLPIKLVLFPVFALVCLVKLGVLLLLGGLIAAVLIPVGILIALIATPFVLAGSVS